MKQTKVNFSFISQLEGGSALEGYVPDHKYSKSGVTIATGFDLGSRSCADLSHLPEKLQIKLKPYLGAMGHYAKRKLQQCNLYITKSEAELIDNHSKANVLNLLNSRFDKSSSAVFVDLPEQAQTVIASVAFQYGDLESRCPNFWSAAIKLDWQKVLHELRDFGDRYHTRRNREADYLETMEAI